MGQKQCSKCGEMVDEAKAFCPGCGNSLVEEKKRTSVSDYDQSNRTVQLGKTMYNQMLSDMGLSIAKPTEQGAKRVESIAPVAPAAPPPPPASGQREPIVEPVRKTSSRNIWIAVAAAVVALGLMLLVIIVLVAALLYFR